MAQNEDPEIDVEAALNELDRKMSRLRVMYEQYFLGIEKRTPTVLQKEVVRSMRVLEGIQMRNTAAKFRLRQMIQKFQSYRAYWLRTSRQIEDGTYRKHVQKLKTRVAREEAAAALEADLGASVAPADRAAPEVAASEAAPPAEQAADKAAAATGALADEFLKSLGMGVAVVGAEKPKPKGPPPAVRGMSADEVKKKDAKLRALKEKLGLDPNAPITSASREKLAAAIPRDRSGARYRVPGTPGSENNAPATDRPPIRPSRNRQPADRPVPGTQPPPAAPQRPAAPAAPPRVAPPERPAPSAPPASGRVQQAASEAGISGDRVQKIYESLREAKRKTGESTGKLSLDSVAKSIAKQAPALRKKYGTDKVDFQVVIKGGKAYLKPQTDK